MNKKFWVYKGLSALFAIGSVFACINQNVAFVFCFAGIAIFLSIKGNKSVIKK